MCQSRHPAMHNACPCRAVIATSEGGLALTGHAVCLPCQSCEARLQAAAAVPIRGCTFLSGRCTPMAGPLRGFCSTPVLGRDREVKSRNHPLVCSASAGEHASRKIAVQLPDGSKKVWLVSSREDLEGMLNTHKASGGAFLNPSNQHIYLRLADLHQDQLYEVLALCIPLPPCIKGFKLVMPGRYPRSPTVEVLHLTEDTLWGILEKINLWGVQAMPGASMENVEVVTWVSRWSLRDNTTYVGELAPPRFIFDAVGWPGGANQRRDETVMAVKALEALAKEENPGATVTPICQKVYQDPQQPKYIMRIDAACIVSLSGKKVAYIANVDHALETASLLALLPSIPALQEDFGECTDAELLVFASALDFEEVPSKLEREIEELGTRLYLRLQNGRQYQLFQNSNRR